jgi:regulator of RNase E activity RraA
MKRASVTWWLWRLRAAGVEGMVIWGLHRDTADIRAIGLPVFSLGAIPLAPSGLTPARMTRWSPPSSDTGQ